MKKMVAVVALASSLALGTAWAGAEHHEGMMTEMMNCSVCKNMAPHMEALMPVMTMEFVEMSNGMAMVHSVTDASKVAKFHEMSVAVQKAGHATKDYTDAQVDEGLCHFCQTIHSLGKEGATISSGLTKDGDLLVITSEDPAVQTKIAAFRTEAEKMMGT